MKKQAGFTLYIVIAALLAFAGMAVALKVQSSRLASCKAEFSAFQAEVKAKGEAAQRESDRINAENAKRKEKSDAERKRLIIANAALADRLRDERSRSRFVPEAAPGAGSPDHATFDRGELESAIQRLDARVSAIVAEGDSARITLDTVKLWAADVVK